MRPRSGEIEGILVVGVAGEEVGGLLVVLGSWAAG